MPPILLTLSSQCLVWKVTTAGAGSHFPPDSTGKSDVVPIGSDGTYCPPIYQILLTAVAHSGYLYDGHQPGWECHQRRSDCYSPGDGSANAPAGAPQLPSLLNGYAVRPPWEVAGVDYAVGVPTGTTLKDPTLRISMSGVSVDTTNRLILVTPW